MKFSKENFGWIFISASLLILLAIAIYLGASGWFFKNDISLTTDLELGKTVSTTIIKNQANSISLTFDGSYLSGERLPQIISIKNGDDSDSLYVRAKVFVYTGDNVNLDMDIVETINWTKNEDGYYYYNDLLNVDASSSLCSYVIVGSEGKFSSKKKYILNVVFESLSSSQDVESIWGVNPIQNICYTPDCPPGSVGVHPNCDCSAFVDTPAYFPWENRCASCVDADPTKPYHNGIECTHCPPGSTENSQGACILNSAVGTCPDGAIAISLSYDLAKIAFTGLVVGNALAIIIGEEKWLYGAVIAIGILGTYLFARIGYNIIKS